MSKTMDTFSPFASGTWWLLSVLNFGIDGHSAINLTASKNGLTLRVGGTVVAKGKTPEELKIAFEAYELRVRTYAARRAQAQAGAKYT